MDASAVPQISVAIGLICLFSALCSFLIAAYGSTRVIVLGYREFVSIFVALGIWCTFAALEYLSSIAESRILFGKLTYLGSQFVAPLWLLFALRFTSQDSWLSGNRYLVLLVLPVITNILVLTNEQHGLVWASIELITEPLYDLQIVHGVWFNFVSHPFNYLMFAVGAIFLARAAFRSESRQYRYQSLLVLSAALIVFVVNLLYLFLGTSLYGMDPTPVVMVLIPLIVFVAINRTDFMERPEISYRSVFMDSSDPIILIDDQSRIVDLNPCARHLVSAEAPIQMALQEVVPGLANDWIASDSISDLDAVPMGSRNQRYRVRVRLLRNTHGRRIGKQLLFQELNTSRSTIQIEQHKDGLTGLCQSPKLVNFMQSLIDEHRFFTLLFIDLNNFSGTVERYGSASADQMVVRVADILRSEEFSRFAVARLDEDHFAMLMADSSRKDGLLVCDRLERTFRNAPVISDEPSINANIGICCFPENGNDVATLLHDMNARMYWVKGKSSESNRIAH